ncbi:hypothetical protein G3I60_35915 [Streptomyces sp. SID13666]|uniref:hypothetical protein n=1 Tax=unclassified Streptomyces TaxID=2593676 RepID=UPI0013C1778A|nr:MULTISPECIES: hypothetical protein [unclassified Streptomyces]NEA59405.1 hypothetical protein [Streptomyces sp. SID13666]NEA72475.1 hypothetical protein [Streptomyces sp. SID13588]
MARAFAKVDTAGSLFMVAVVAVDKLKETAEGMPPERAFDRMSGEALSVVNLVETFEGRAQILKITVPESQLPKGMAPGSVVRPVGLVASPWGMPGMGGQVNVGLSYRAEGLELAK